MAKQSSGNRVLMLLSNPATYDLRPLKEARALAEAGYDVTLLAWDRSGSAPRHMRDSKGFQIQRFPLRGSYGQSIQTLLGMALFYVWTILSVRRRRFEVIHCNDVDTLFCGLILKVISGGPRKVVYDMHDLPGVFLSSFPLSGMLVRLVYLLSSNHVDRVEVVNERFVDYLSERGIKKEKMVVVMNVPDEHHIPPHTRAPGGLQILYYGSMSRDKSVHNLVSAVLGLDQTSLALAGRGDLVPWIEEVAKSSGNVRFLGWLPVEKLREKIDEADLIPILYRTDNPNAVLAAPNKLFDAIYRGIPVMANAGTYFSEVVAENECGLVVDGEDPSSIRLAIVTARDDLDLYHRMAGNCLNLAKSKFSWETSRSNLVSMYGELVSSVTSPSS